MPPRQDIETLDARKFGTGFLGYGTVPGEVDDGDPVTSIDQLYIQASALNPLLQHLVIKWASLSRGMFLYRSASEGNQGTSLNAGQHTQRYKSLPYHLSVSELSLFIHSLAIVRKPVFTLLFFLSFGITDTAKHLRLGSMPKSVFQMRTSDVSFH